MVRYFSAALAALAALALPAMAAMPARTLSVAPEMSPDWRAPGLPAPEVVHLPPLREKAVAVDEDGRVRLGPVREVATAGQALAWHAVPGGFAARIRATSEGAAGLRVKLSLGAVPGAFELRAQGAAGGVETQVVDPLQGPEAWGPWTDGATQELELFSRVRPSPDAVAVSAVLHAALSPTAKAAGTCTIPTACGTGDPTLDAAVASAKKAVTRLSFVENGSGYYCTGTLINTELFPAAYLLTANHCISTQAAAASLTTLWFYENPTCSTADPAVGQVQVAGGASLAFTNYSVDSTLLLLSSSPPAGATYASWSANPLPNGSLFVSISHPQGDTSRIAQGSVSGSHRFSDYPQDMYLTQFSRGIIQGGSSGSGLFVLNNGTLELRALLFGSTVGSAGGMSCTNTTERGIYGHLDIFAPQIAPFITRAGKAADDAPNRIADVPPGIDAPLEQSSSGLSYPRAIDYPGDVDVFRFSLGSSAVVGAWSEGPSIDTVGTILDSAGTAIEANDDAQVRSNHFGITRTLGPGTYYLQVEHWEPGGTGPYTARIQAWSVGNTNYTNLWWNPSEPGWGLNVNHQGNILFATLFTYDRDGSPMWLVMSEGAKQADGSFAGTLYRARGPAFNAIPWSAVSLTPVGTMSLQFSDARNGTLAYTVDGTRVARTITVQAFDAPLPTCTWSAFDRSYASNVQDLWWNPAESGWGLNLAHQGDTVFGTLFTYDASGKGAWFVMSAGTVNPDGRGFSGTLYRTAARSFDASPWVPATVTAVGTMQGTIANGNAMTLTYTVDGVSVTKQVQRQAFSSPKPECGQ